MSLGIGLCRAQNEFPTGTDVVESVKNVAFVGSGGPVSYDTHTGTRSEESVKVRVINILVDTSGSTIRSTEQTAALVNVSPGEVEVISPFVYSDGTFEPPLSLPPLKVELNLIGTGARAFGWTVAAVVILLSILFCYKV
jgi:hypothetical protein